jgi:hypothetical protein
MAEQAKQLDDLFEEVLRDIYVRRDWRARR